MIGPCPWCGEQDWQRRDDWLVCATCYGSFQQPEVIEQFNDPKG